MSDTTPRPDQTPSDPTAPPPPADVEHTEVVPPPPPPAAQQEPAYPPPAYPPPVDQPGAQAVPYSPGPTPMSPQEERTTGMAAHGVALLATVVSAGLLSFVVALVMYLVFRDRGPFVRHHSANALNVQIIVGIVFLISIPLMFVLIGFVTFAAAWVFAVIVHIIGAVKANNGEWYNPPLTPNFVK
jgi:uncharacterized Tic20 family protein